MLPCHSYLNPSCRFLWAFCQVDYLRWCFPQDIQRALYDLPVTLDEAYQRSLLKIKNPKWKYAHRLFQFIAVSSHPLLVEELAVFLAFDFDAGLVPKFLPNRIPPKPDWAVLSVSTSLLAVVKVGESSLVHFSHSSVKDFLMSERIAEAEQTISRYQIRMLPAHSMVAQTCLALLLQLEPNVNVSRVESIPLARYAALHWVDHVQLEQASLCIQDSIRQLLDQGKPNLPIWVWICDVILRLPLQTIFQNMAYLVQNDDEFVDFQDMSSLPIFKHSQKVKPPVSSPLPLHCTWHLKKVFTQLLAQSGQEDARIRKESTPLFWALRNGFSEFAWILLQHGGNANVWDDYNKTPLHWAAEEGLIEDVQVLLEHGANVNARDEDNKTPLHWASQRGLQAVVEILLRHGGEVDALDDYNKTPLHLASARGVLEVTQLLLAYEGDANSRDDYDKTPLHWAAEGGFLEVVRILLDHGADADARDDNDQTPSHIASVQGHVVVVQLLLEHCVKADPVST